MADFVAVLQKAIEALAENSPENRERIYQKARTTIEAKLAAISPPPSAELAERQKSLLEEAIAKVEAVYAPPPPLPPDGPEDDLDSLINELSRMPPVGGTANARPEGRGEAAEEAAGEDEHAPAMMPAPEAPPMEDAAAHHEEAARQEPVVEEEPAGAAAPEEVEEIGTDEPEGPGQEPEYPVGTAPAWAAGRPDGMRDERVEPREEQAEPQQAMPDVETPLTETPDIEAGGEQVEPQEAWAEAETVGERWSEDENTRPAADFPGPLDEQWVPPEREAAPDTPPERVDAGSTKDDEGTVFAEAPAGLGPLADEPAAEEAAAARSRQAVPPSSRGWGRSIALLLVLAILGGVAASAWLYRDEVARAAGFGSFGAAVAALQGVFEGGAEDEPQPEIEPELAAAAESAETEDVLEPAVEQPTPEVEPERQKFTQRLLPDGQEVDEGPAGGEPAVGEGTSVAAATQNSAPAAEADQQRSVPVGQKAIFYEERTSVSDATADGGSVTWSLVQESPGENLPPEPAIRADATIPKKGLQLKMTIRRNADESLPASHIIELIFLAPEQFAGGSINNVLRIAMKESEQDTGSPLLGVPAKIADGFFLVALSDSSADLETNSTLLRRQSWIDIPIIYASGRRALVTLEKGPPGDQVFQEALEAWQQASSSSDG